MLFKTLKKLVERDGLTAELASKIDTFYALGKLTEAQYTELVGTEE